MTSRRSFIKQSGVLTAGLMVEPSGLFYRRSAMGIQLYTLRNEIEKDPRGVIGSIAAAGYKKVETYGYGSGKFFGLTVQEFGQLLKDNRLNSPSGHYSPGKFLFANGNGDDVKELIEVAKVLGHEYIVIPHLPENERKTADQYKKLAERMNQAGELCKAARLQLGYHNHNFEFITLEGGQHGFDILLSQTDPALVKFEMDIYWVVRAGYDPIDLISKHPGRFPMWHVKDMSKIDRDENTEIGNGSIDFKKIFAVSRLSGLRHFYLEQENNYFPDALGSIVRSAEYIKANLP